jgi:hypothetical protein
VNALAVSGEDLYVGGWFRTSSGAPWDFIARWDGGAGDGGAWHPLDGGTNGTVYALAVDGGGTLYAGGSFGTAGGADAANIARWTQGADSGGSWDPLGSGVSDTVYALAPKGARIYAAGGFTEAGGKQSVHFGLWEPKSPVYLPLVVR